jgi:8-oxo-dGTP pyrophosphatase MutT (NUDIX family)
MNYASGIILQSSEGRVLILQRSKTGDHAGEWCFPGGGVEDGETTPNAAVRECLEETGYRVGSVGAELCTRVAEDVHFTTYLVKVDDEFVPRLNSEHVAWAWVKPADVLLEQPIAAPLTVETIQ